jgi:hypothetical protein
VRSTGKDKGDSGPTLNGPIVGHDMPIQIQQDGVFAVESEFMIATSMFSALPIDASGVLSRAFWISLLLSGQTKLAENAVLEAICCSESNSASDGVCLLDALRTAVRETEGVIECGDAELLLLPPELQRVLFLPVRLRHCFVLRILVGLSPEICSQLLRMHIDQITGATGAAAQQLVLLRQDCPDLWSGASRRLFAANGNSINAKSRKTLDEDARGRSETHVI